MINCNFSVIRTYIRLWWSTISWQLNCSRGFGPKIWRRQVEIYLWNLKSADVHIQKVNTWLATFHNLDCENHPSPPHKPAINSFLFPKVIYCSRNDLPQVDNGQSRRVAEITPCKVQRCTGEQNNYQRVFPGNPQGVEGSMELPWPHLGGNSASRVCREGHPEEAVWGKYCKLFNQVIGYQRWNWSGL